jgi:hypothetical protein
VVTLRFDARPKDVLLAAGQRVHGGEAFVVDNEEALRLLTDPNVSVTDLDDLTRDQLDELAEAMGVDDPDRLHTKADVVDAIDDEAETEQSEADDGEGHDNEETD